MLDIEASLIRAFVVARKQERYLGFIENAKRRKRFLEELYHFADFDPAYTVEISPREQTAPGILALLRTRHAPETCYVVSTDDEIDQTMMSLPDVLTRIVGGFEGTILSCIPGRLAYFEGESPANRLILERRR